MNTAGIIAEYNPLHNGHRFQMETLRRETEAEFLIVAMSGDFVQRGEPAICDKYTRTRMALEAGADLVVEIPSLFASASAEDFAACGVALLDRLGVVNTLCFGSECNDLNTMAALAHIFTEEPKPYSDCLSESIRQGLTFPQARRDAVLRLFSKNPKKGFSDLKMLEKTLASPNNILGIEYLKALEKRRSAITPFSILRKGHGYHDLDISEDFASASALRDAWRQGNLSPMEKQMPRAAFDLVCGSSAIPVFADDFSAMLNYRLLELCHCGTDLSLYADVSRELSNRIYDMSLNFVSFSRRIDQLKTRQYTYTRVSRALLHILLGTTNDLMADARKLDHCPYARILGFKKSAAPLLNKIKKQTQIPMITKVADAQQVLSPGAYEIFRQDLFSSHLYQSVVARKSGAAPRNEFTRPLIILP